MIILISSMTIQQISYILAVAEYQHFEKAAESCFVTQSTLSTMISKLEKEIDIKIFDRKKKPVQLTKEGKDLIPHLKKIKIQMDELIQITHELKGEIKGKINIAVIPTIAPFLLPLFLQEFATEFPDLDISVREQTTNEIIRSIKDRELDIGILSTPIKVDDIIEYPLYQEPFLYYDNNILYKEEIDPEDLNVDNLCLLEEGHCMRTQIVNLCDTNKLNLKNTLNFDYKAGSIDSLMRFVRFNNATTLLPYLATLDLPEAELKKIKPFSHPTPYRSIGLVVHNHFVKHKILNLLSEKIKSSVQPLMPNQILKGSELSPM